MSKDSANPLLFAGGLPPFDQVRPEHVVPAMRQLLAELGEELEGIEAAASPGWEAAVEAPAALGERLGRAWGVVGHLMGVRNSDELRAAYEEMQPEVVAFGLRMAQSRPLYDALEGLAQGDGFAGLDATRQRIVESGLRDAQLAGVALEGDADFDRVVLVYYPGVEYFVDMVQSEFYTGIFGGKQLGDNLSTPTVPILQHL